MKQLARVKQKERSKGITLIALVITIIVLIILAAVSISSLTGDNGILTRVNEAEEETGKATAREKVEMAVLASYGRDGNIDLTKLNTNLAKVEGIDENTIPISNLPATVRVDGYGVMIDEKGRVTASGKGETGKPSTEVPTEMTLDEAKAISKFTTKTKVVDDDGNTFFVPEGFKIHADSDYSGVGGGIVIEDVSNGPTAGSQFVWIPVGDNINYEIHVEEVVILDRYSFASDGTPSSLGESKYGFYQELAESNYGNTTAISISDFKNSVNLNGGYYIGRFEARTPNRRTSMTSDQELGEVNVKR